MKSYNSFYVFHFCAVMVLLITWIAKARSLAPYNPQCIQNICQNLPSHLNSPQCHQDECSTETKNDLLQKRTHFCLNGCNNFKKAIQDHPEEGCSMFCNLTKLESSSSWNDKLERLPVLSCIFGCERAMKNFVTHILSEVQTIVPPQILRKNGDKQYYNETSETVTFGSQIEKDISGKLVTKNKNKFCDN